MWPELLDMTREESKRILRRVELEAYSSVVSAFRAQGDLTKEKKKILHDLQQMLSISTERHRAEVRRAVNDEKLATIAENMCPSNSTQEWLIEGRRLVPLMPRLVPQTAFTVTANQVANMQAEKNASLPSPSQTGIREAQTAPQMASPPPTPRATSRPSSPTSNVVVLPSGMSIHIRGGLNTEEDEDVQIRKRKRSTSTENLVSPTGSQIPQVTYTTTMASTMPTVSPKKITISKSPQSQPRVVVSGSQTQKVILVSGQNQAQQGLLPQKTLTGPHRSTVSTGTSTSTHNINKSIIYPSSSIVTNTNLGNVVTVSTPAVMASTTSTVTAPLPSIGTSTTAFLTPTISVSRPRFKTVPRQKILQVPQPRPGVVIPMGPQPVQPSPQSIQGLKPVTKNTPTIQIRQEGGMKIITQNIQGSTSKILPKPSQLSSSGTPVVVVSAGSNTPSSTVTMVNKAASSITGTPTGTKVLNIQTQGGKIISAPRGSSVVTVNPKTLHLTAVKNASGITGTKPNVIVVQKTQPRRAGSLQGQGTPKGSTTAVISSPFEKELVSFLQKQDPSKQYVVTTTTANLSRTSDTQRKVIVTTSGHGDLAKQLTKTLQQSRAETSQQSSTILHDLIQAAGIVPDSGQDTQSGEVTLNLDESQLAALTSAAQGTSQPKVSVSQSMPNNEWFEYDVTDEQGNTYTHTAESADTAAAIQSLLDMQANSAGQKPKVTVQRSASVDIGQLSDHLNQQQLYTLEQAMTLLNQPDSSTDKDVQSQSQVPSVHSEQTILESTDTGSEDIYTAVPLKSVLNTSQPSSTILLPSATSTVTQGTKVQVVRKGHDLGEQGDLDPQTGMFYMDSKNGTDLVTKEVVIMKSGSSSSSSVESSKNYDLLSSSLAQAQIDLDPFQFIDESQIQSTKVVEAESVIQPSETTIIDSPTIETFDTSQTIPEDSSQQQQQQVVVQKVVMTTPSTACTQTVRIQPSSTFIPLQEMVKTGTGKTSTISITSAKQLPGAVTLNPQSAAPSSIHVTVEPSGIDTSHMKIEDFTSQQLLEKGDFVGVDHLEEIATMSSPSGGSGLSDSQGESSSLFDSQQYHPSKRKRHYLSGEESAGSPPSGFGAAGSWVRAALGVLNKVSKYRGINREKNDLNAAAWFTQPVDPEDAPDYYAIVENPMDFGTIKRKLEGSKYPTFEDFHADMMLVRDNCFLYNPELSRVRKDCDEVFNFYSQEYSKLMEKWQKTHIASPVSKKPRADRSPIRP